MFSRILIANRGEIACRVIETARRMGVISVAVYSDADRNARHVRLADVAVGIGPAPARESYLHIRRIIEAAQASGAQAVHPGYGFLSENADFAQACADAGLVFIGPPPLAIRAMGAKSAAKALMEKAGVPLTPGYHGEDQAAGFLHRQADAIGYPVLIKASAGGGGKGMRRVDRSDEFPAALASCRRESVASFGDDRVLIEKYLVRPRHIEIQVFADTLGHCVHLFERDCSVQRRHQKVLEEAPAPGMSPERRLEMGQAAIAAARAVGYVGAGTVEFIATDTFEQDGPFYFMEMNTRLQVEHPVTEMITGLDLVEWQLRVACGEPLPLAQDQLAFSGHAIEARIYAEDPGRDFLPSPGRLIHLATPMASTQLRIETGVEEGDEIPSFYDPMIAKLVVHDSDRKRALARLQQALAQYQIVGVTTNLEFLQRLVACPAYSEAHLDTALIERERDHLFGIRADVPYDVWLLAALAELLRERQTAGHHGFAAADPYSPWHLRDGWRLNVRAERLLKFRCGEVERSIGVRYARSAYSLSLDDHRVDAAGEFVAQRILRAEIDGRKLSATVVAAAEKRWIFLNGCRYALSAIDPLQHAGEAAAADGHMMAPMPGRIIALLAEPGVHVEKGAPLLIMEAMKMEHTISAAVSGTLKRFCFAVGDQVSDGMELVEIG